MVQKRHRQGALLRLVSERRVSSQAEIVRLLAERGIQCTQASISRDLRELGLVKLEGSYLPAGRLLGRRPSEPARQPSNELIRSIEPVGANLIVVRTREGAANAVAVELDRRRLGEIAGTLAGDDTIFVAVRSRSAQGRALALLKGLAPSG